MKTYDITNANISYYVDSIWIPVNATEKEINDGLDNAEMDITVTWDDDWSPAPFDTLHFDYQSPYTAEPGTTSLVGYLDLRKLCKVWDISFRYMDAWGVEQDKIPLIIKAVVGEREEEE